MLLCPPEARCEAPEVRKTDDAAVSRLPLGAQVADLDPPDDGRFVRPERQSVCAGAEPCRLELQRQPVAAVVGPVPLADARRATHDPP